MTHNSHNNNFSWSGFLGKKNIGRSLLDDSVTVCIKYNNGRIVERHGVLDPYKLMSYLRRDFNVEKTWIKDA
jgi:hypothetical protein